LLLAMDGFARWVAAAMAVVALAGLAAAAPAEAARAPARPVIGIADQKPEMFSDSRFAWLHIRHARLVVPWYLFTRGGSRQQAGVRAWLTAARRARVRPLVSFADGYRRDLMGYAPTSRQFRRGFLRFRRAFPSVRQYIPWNEANRCAPSPKRSKRARRRFPHRCVTPRLLARYYDTMRSRCRRCRVLAGAFVTYGNELRFVRRFQRVVRHRPRLWALHNYGDVNRLVFAATRHFLDAVRGRVWLTETGGIVRRRRTKRSGTWFPQTKRHAGEATAYLLRRSHEFRARIARIYLYHWDVQRPNRRWDSALIGPHGRARPAFSVLARYLGRRPSRAPRPRRLASDVAP
jgi:hypothetical protein